MVLNVPRMGIVVSGFYSSTIEQQSSEQHPGNKFNMVLQIYGKTYGSLMQMNRYIKPHKAMLQPKTDLFPAVKNKTH